MIKKPSKNATVTIKQTISAEEKDKQSILEENMNGFEEQGSEAVKVALRIRPMNEL